MTTTMGIAGTIGLISMIWVLYEVWAGSANMRTGEKVIWTIAAICFSFITAIAFYIIVKRNMVRT